MRTSDVDILIIPGLTNSGPDHWQSRWQRSLSTSQRVEQTDWDRPEREAWTARLIAAVAATTRPAVLVGHSCGSATVAHAAPRLPPGRVVGAFLVAPGSEAGLAGLPGIDANFRPYPRQTLPFPSLLVASRSDPHCSYEDAAALAAAWGAELVDAGDSGHLNTTSGHGPWPDGLLRFGVFLRNLG